MNQPRRITVRRMTKAEMKYAEDWANEEGWNPGLNDVACYQALDDGGFLLAEADGAPAGCIFCINFNAGMSLVGVLIVKAEYRGGRVARALCMKALEYIGARTIGFDALASKAHGYSLFGFKPAHEITRYEMPARPVESDIETVDLAAYPFAKLMDYDRLLFPADRAKLMSLWIRQGPLGCALGAIKNNELTGYGVIRRAYQGYRLEPLYADSPELAEGLLLALTSRVAPGSPIYLNVPVPNAAACALAGKYGMKPTISMVRMYNRIPREYGVLERTYSQMG